MSLQSSSLGRFWLGPQVERASAATTFYGFKGNLIDVAPGQMLRNLGQMVGSGLLPEGSVKTAAWSGGAAVFPPALDDYLGWLLYAFAGSASGVNNGDGTYTHYFPSGGDNIAVDKYLTARRSVPATSTLYEQMQDMRPIRILLQHTPGEFTTMRYELIGRTPSAPDGSGWTYTAKGKDSVPIACKGTFEVPDGSALATVNGVTLELLNGVPDLRRVLVHGDYYPYDFPVLARGVTCTFSFLWQNSDLYKSLYYDGTAWTPIIYNTSLDVSVESPGFITGALPYILKFYAQSMDFTCTPVRLAGGDLVELAVTGTLAESASGFDWYLALTNGTASYIWPT